MPAALALRLQPTRALPVKELEFAVGDSKDTYPFKPTDIVVQRDGSLMVSDYADGQRPKRGRGRIYHISFSRDSKRSADLAPAPNLESDSYYDRCEAQRTLEKSGKKPDRRLRRQSGHSLVLALFC